MIAFLRRLGYWLRGRRAANDLEEELQFHRDMTEQDLRRDGVPAPEAQRTARRVMGNTTLAREDARAVWVAPWIDAVWQDIRHAARSLRRSPGLVVVSALSLGLGIGLNAVLFMGISTVYANQFSYPDYEDLKGSGIFADALGFRTGGLNMGSAGRLTPITLLVVTANYFEALGVRAQRGRVFSAAEAAPERNPRVVVVTASFWRNWLRGDPAAIGNQSCSAVSPSPSWACFPTTIVRSSAGLGRRSTLPSAD
jgi:MacB-like periplasmic core domain